MARSSDPNSAGSQFFICVSDASHLDGKYTAFGEVIENISVIDYIVNSMTDSKQIEMLSQNSIPDGEDPKDWIKLKNPKTRRFIYLEIPEGETRQSFEYETKKKLMSDNPIAGAGIKKIRVVEE